MTPFSVADRSVARSEGRPRVRRSSQEVCRLVLEAARSTFAANGYAGSSIREIAERAGVAEGVLFRHFATKKQLFQRAVSDKFDELVAGHLEHWEAISGDDLQAAAFPSHDHVTGLYDLLREHRGLVMAVLTAQAYEVDLSRDALSAPLSRALDLLQSRVATELDRRGLVNVDIPITARLIFGMVMAMAVLDEPLLGPPSLQPSHKGMLDEMVACMVHGVAHRPPGQCDRGSPRTCSAT